MIKYLIQLTLSVMICTTAYANVGMNGDMIKQIKHLDVFLIKAIPNIDKVKKKTIELKVMNYGIHNCTLMGQVWQEDTKSFQALLVETEYLLCGKTKYPAYFYSRVIFDRRLSLNSESQFGSFAEAGLEIFLIKTK